MTHPPISIGRHASDDFLDLGAKQLVWSNPVPARNQRHQNPACVGLLTIAAFSSADQCPPTLDRGDHLNSFGLSSHRHTHSHGFLAKEVGPVQHFKGPFQHVMHISRNELDPENETVG